MRLVSVLLTSFVCSVIGTEEQEALSLRRRLQGTCAASSTAFTGSLFVQVFGIDSTVTTTETSALGTAFMAAYNSAASCPQAGDSFTLTSVEVVAASIPGRRELQTTNTTNTTNSQTTNTTNSTDLALETTSGFRMLFNIGGDCVGCDVNTVALNMTTVRRILSESGLALANEDAAMTRTGSRQLQTDSCCSSPLQSSVLTQFNTELDSLVTAGTVSSVTNVEDMVLLEPVTCSADVVTFNTTAVIAAQIDLSQATTTQVAALEQLILDTYNTLNLATDEICDSTFRRATNVAVDVSLAAQTSTRLQTLTGNPWYVSLVATIEVECLGCNPEASIFSASTTRLILNPAPAASVVLDDVVANCLCAVNAASSLPNVLEFEVELESAITASPTITFINLVNTVYEAEPATCSQGLSNFEMTVTIDLGTSVSALTTTETNALELALYQDYNNLNAFNDVVCDTGFPVVTDVVISASFSTNVDPTVVPDCAAFPCGNGNNGNGQQRVSVCRNGNSLCIAEPGVQATDTCGTCATNNTATINAFYTGQCRGCGGSPLLFTEIRRRLQQVTPVNTCWCGTGAGQSLPTQAEFMASLNSTILSVIPDTTVTDAFHVLPSSSPTVKASVTPSIFPSDVPSAVPSSSPSDFASDVPTTSPSTSPMTSPSTSPTTVPTVTASGSPSIIPTSSPTVATAAPTGTPDNNACIYSRVVDRTVSNPLFDNTRLGDVVYQSEVETCNLGYARRGLSDVEELEGEGTRTLLSITPSTDGNGIWFKLAGDGDLWTINTCTSNFNAGVPDLTAFSGTCTDLICEHDGGAAMISSGGCQLNLLTTAGTEYYILVQSRAGGNGVVIMNFDSTDAAPAAAAPSAAAPASSTMTMT